MRTVATSSSLPAKFAAAMGNIVHSRLRIIFALIFALSGLSPASAMVHASPMQAMTAHHPGADSAAHSTISAKGHHHGELSTNAAAETCNAINQAPVTGSDQNNECCSSFCFSLFVMDCCAHVFTHAAPLLVEVTLHSISTAELLLAERPPRA